MTSVISYTGKRIFSLFGMFLRHPAQLYKKNKNGKEHIKNLERKTKIQYEIPTYKKEMNYCKSTKKYLRSVRLCNTQAPAIIAMANKLGAYQINDQEYAKNVFNFVKNNIRSRNVPVFGAEKTLKKGYGSCFDSSSLFIALCRCGGISARYKIYLHKNPPAGFQTVSTVDDQKLLDSLAIVTSFYTVAEVKIDEEWIECEVCSSPELDAYWNVPIAKFGENCGNVTGWFPDNILYLEKLTLRVIISTNIFFKLFGGIVENINEQVERNWEEGRRKLEKTGIEEYNKKAKRRYEYFPSLEDQTR